MWISVTVPKCHSKVSFKYFYLYLVARRKFFLQITHSVCSHIIRRWLRASVQMYAPIWFYFRHKREKRSIWFELTIGQFTHVTENCQWIVCGDFRHRWISCQIVRWHSNGGKAIQWSTSNGMKLIHEKFLFWSHRVNIHRRWDVESRVFWCQVSLNQWRRMRSVVVSGFIERTKSRWSFAMETCFCVICSNLIIIILQVSNSRWTHVWT